MESNLSRILYPDFTLRSEIECEGKWRFEVVECGKSVSLQYKKSEC